MFHIFNVKKTNIIFIKETFYLDLLLFEIFNCFFMIIKSQLSIYI